MKQEHSTFIFIVFATAILALCVSFFINTGKASQQENLGGGAEITKPKTITLKDVVLDEGVFPEHKTLWTKVNLFNQLKAQGAITTFVCKGDVVSCIMNEVDRSLKEYKVTEVSVKTGAVSEKYDVALNSIKAVQAVTE